MSRNGSVGNVNEWHWLSSEVMNRLIVVVGGFSIFQVREGAATVSYDKIIYIFDDSGLWGIQCDWKMLPNF